MLVWKCDDTVIYKRRKGKIDPNADVDVQGSLILNNISKSMACAYKAEHHDRDGKKLKTHSLRLCVFSRAPTPKLAVNCSTGVAILWCEPESFPEDLTLSWVHNNRVIKEKSNPLQLGKDGESSRYRCRLSNSLETKDSNEETALCEVSGSYTSDNKLICLFKLVVVGLLSLVWTVLLVVRCKSCLRQKRKHGERRPVASYEVRKVQTSVHF
ncbi:uncharacterized protein LOC134070831 [Sardina pilchardus]|uniref:uncharacterized protein LOC134070831 n=1 Tax=Sardina pilchardus TaxID=27697 RepID=UPI002E0DD108